jgi:hypothetical protein
MDRGVPMNNKTAVMMGLGRRGDAEPTTTDTIL